MSRLDITLPVYKGRLEWNNHNKQMLKMFLSSIENGKYVYITINKHKKRSSKQNNYYWGTVLSTISKVTGHTKEELHEIFKQIFLGRKFITLAGKEIEINKSTKKLKTKEFNEYIEQIVSFASEQLGIVIFEPITNFKN